MTLELLPQPLAVCRLSAEAEFPSWISGDFQSVTRTSSELSIICSAEGIPEEVQAERGWRGLHVVGTLEFHLTGILAALASPLAEAGISIFALSTFDTDYLLVKEDVLEPAIQTLEAEGHEILQKVAA